MENCHNYADVNVESMQSEYGQNSFLYVGGIVGYSSAMNNCTNYGDINIYSEDDVTIYAGGLVADYSNAANSRNYGSINVNGTKAKDIIIGGISSRSNGIYACSNYGNIIIDAGIDYSSIKCGGITSEIIAGTDINGCMNNGEIVVDVTGNGENPVICGGILAQYDKPYYSFINEIKNSYNTGSISINIDNGASYAAGIVGAATFNDNLPHGDEGNHVKITSCYNTGTIEAETAAGIMAFTNDEAIVIVDNSFMADYNVDNNYGETLSTDFMKTDEFVTKLNKYGNYFKKDTEPFMNDGYPIIDYSNINGTVNVDEVTTDIEVCIYPNPASDFVKVSTDNSQSL